MEGATLLQPDSGRDLNSLISHGDLRRKLSIRQSTISCSTTSSKMKLSSNGNCDCSSTEHAAEKGKSLKPVLVFFTFVLLRKPIADAL